MAVVMVASLVERAAAADAPAPSPVSGAPISAPAVAVLSLTALAFEWTPLGAHAPDGQQAWVEIFGGCRFMLDGQRSSTILPPFHRRRGTTSLILAQHPEFSTFNHYLTITRLASEINRRLTITVLAVDNTGMASLLAKHFTLPTLKNILLLHVLVDFYVAKKLHQLTGD
ncbi:hypothetical protein J5N97_010535 [Dioscorea zingiberensis]|uniref:FAS1 domain-containing protein n=1 Tax=Dioscorea zingiberensis TaxID=325984 RepID=A0A9D5CYK5_9LILI|nr:hypothetical protein J5N97_010535 [Dioscorea zingiberensis]